MDGGIALFFMTLSGATALINATTDAVVWPLSKTVCRPGQKMTVEHGCDGLDADSAGRTGRGIALVCCVLSACMAWRAAGVVAALVFCALCCVSSLLAYRWEKVTRQKVNYAGFDF